MAQRVNIVLTDDLDGSDASETVTFALDGHTYEIDLSAENAERLRDALRPFVAAGRKISGRAAAPARPTGRRRAAASGSATDIRAWAQEQGLQVSTRGRVPAEIRAAYEAAH
nr:Lsr2 family protein [Propionibacterium sp.]